MADPIVYGPGYSTYVRTARLALEEKAVAYKLEEFDFIQGGMPPEQLARQPFGKVPAFEHDGFALYETDAITRYVDEAFPGPALQPDGARDRARMNQILSILGSYTYAPTVGALVIQRLVVPMAGGEPDEAMIDKALPEVDKCMQVLEGLLGTHAYFVNDKLSLADLHLIPIYAYFCMTPESAGILEKTPGLRQWWDGISARDSVEATQPQLG
ncbi:MAG: glutathione S-transferase family protein [Gammaproteobacteria bacterium]|nr:glutathione S-transferase family protein [Gammaproteobacteria bacterium]